MLPKNGNNGINWKVIFIGYAVILWIWIHYCHVASWCSGNYTDGFMALMMHDNNPYRILNASNWPLNVVDFASKSGVSNIDLLRYALMESFMDPFNLSGTVLMNGLALLGIATMFFFVFSWSSQLRRDLLRQDAAGKEYGSAKFLNNKDIDEFLKAKAKFYWRDHANKKDEPDKDLQMKALKNQNITEPSKEVFGQKPLSAKDALNLFEEQKKNGIEDPNILLGVTSEGKTVKYSLDNEYVGHNVSSIVVGSAGAGKTFKYIKPNLAQMNCSFIVTDPSGEIMRDIGMMLLRHGYRVRLFSTSDMAHTDCYNPFDYIYGPDGVTVDQTKVGILVSTFMANADETKKGAKGGDDFWKKAPQAFMTAAVYYCVDFLPVERRNMATILRLTTMGKTDEGSSSSKTELDKIFEKAKADNPKSKAFESYAVFKLAPAKTANSILISLGVDLTKFSDDGVYNMTTTDYLCKRDKKTGYIKEYIYPVGDKRKNRLDRRPIRSSHNIDLETIGDEKTAIFVNIPQANSAYNFLVSMMYAQLFDVLYTRAEKVSPDRFHIYDKYGDILSSQYVSEDEANRFIKLFSESEIKKEGERVFLYNKKATFEDSIPEYGAGYLKEVFDENVANNFINRYKEAYVKQGKLKLPVHVKFMLDEFANIGTIPGFDKILATARKYEISATVVIQSFVQLETMFDKSWETIVGNCSTLIYLGATEYKTQEYMSKLLGKATIRSNDESMSKQSNGGSSTVSLKKMGRDLMTVDEVGGLDPNHEIVMVNGSKKFYLRKLSFAEHPHFKESATGNKANALDKDYLESHFKNETKHSLNEYEDFQTEKRTENIMDGGTGLTSGSKGANPFAKTAKVPNKKALSATTGIPEAKLEEAAKKVKSVEQTEDQLMANGMDLEAINDIPGIESSVHPKAEKKKTTTTRKKKEVVEVAEPEIKAEAESKEEVKEVEKVEEKSSTKDIFNKIASSTPPAFTAPTPEISEEPLPELKTRKKRKKKAETEAETETKPVVETGSESSTSGTESVMSNNEIMEAANNFDANDMNALFDGF